jgi:predicted CoA-binding protein
MTSPASDRDIAAEILRRFRRIAVVGISPDEERPSFRVATYLREAGFDVVPVNPHLTTWCGLPCYPSVRDAPGPIDVVDVFRRSELVDPVVDDAIAAGAHAVWMQDGVINPRAAATARAAGLLVVMDRCMLRDHRMMVAAR